MELYVKQRAWLETCAKDQEEVRGANVDEILLPQLDNFEYIIDFLYRIGPIGITWGELNAWKRLTKISLTGWEAETLKILSDTYQESAQEFSGKDVDAPYLNSEMKAKVTASNIKSILRRPVA